MNSQISIDVPQEILLGVHVNAEEFAKIMKWKVAISLFDEGKIASGMAAQWLNVSRLHFLSKAMESGACLLEDSQDDFRRETSLL
ncbi:MAG: UPF0175 family protein [Deltaproteobacteria bacterium]|nr:UPF0175 family protein [Deltaproteobacteria bacterium]